MAKTVIGIDPGKGGGIAQYKKGFASAVAMPENVKRLNEYLIQLRDNNPEIVVFVEKVQAFVEDDEVGGLKFGINKLLAQFEQIKTVLIINDIPFIEVHPKTWQSPLNLPKGLSSMERKNLYKQFAQQHFPEAKVNLKTADALCIMYFGLQKLITDIHWINQKIIEFKSEGFF